MTFPAHAVYCFAQVERYSSDPSDNGAAEAL